MGVLSGNCSEGIVELIEVGLAVTSPQLPTPPGMTVQDNVRLKELSQTIRLKSSEAAASRHDWDEAISDGRQADTSLMMFFKLTGGTECRNRRGMQQQQTVFQPLHHCLIGSFQNVC